jgi:hypothetical protein
MCEFTPAVAVRRAPRWSSITFALGPRMPRARNAGPTLNAVGNSSPRAFASYTSHSPTLRGFLIRNAVRAALLRQAVLPEIAPIAGQCIRWEQIQRESDELKVNDHEFSAPPLVSFCLVCFVLVFFLIRAD